MDEELDTESANSVNYLIGELCHSLAMDYPAMEQNFAVMKRFKASAFEILLKKSPRPNFYATEETGDDPFHALELQVSAARVNTHSDPEECAKYMDLKSLLERLRQESYFTEGVGYSVLQLLVAVHTQMRKNDQTIIKPRSQLLVPGAFKLHNECQGLRPYPELAMGHITTSEPRYFKVTSEVEYSKNPYFDKMLLDGRMNQLTKCGALSLMMPPAKIPDHSAFTGMAQGLCDAECIEARPFGLLLLDEEKVNKKPSKLKSDDCAPLTSPLSSKELVRHAEDEQYVLGWDWENLGGDQIPRPKHFVGETVSLFDLACVHNAAKHHGFVAKVVSRKVFMRDLKALTVGIQSDTFTHDDHLVFNMEPNITVAGVLPQTIRDYVEEFLECGTCYKRLQMLTKKEDYKLAFDGFIFKALCSAVDEYLLTFLQNVYARKAEQLAAFSNRMKSLIKQLCQLSITLGVHPIALDIKPPLGSQFLGYLYKEIQRHTEKSFITLLVFMLKRCCHVYFKHLQSWIYHGLLDDPSSELFISFLDHYLEKTKYFYDKAYFVRKEAVPGFFLGYEDRILQCGKYTMLLKAYRPTHPLFDLDYPPLSVCLHLEEIRKLEDGCAKYTERAIQACGPPITVRHIFETCAEERSEFIQMVHQCWRENMAKWEDERKALVQERQDLKKKRWEELSTLLLDAKARKVNERRANVELELKYLKEAQQKEEEELQCEDINLRRRILYFQECSESLQQEANEVNAANKEFKSTFNIASSDKASSQHSIASTAGAESYVSCCEGDDSNSEFIECLSEQFPHGSAEVEQEVAESELVLKAKTSEDCVVKNDSSLTLKRSASDIINSNELPMTSVMERNRQRAMSSTNVQQCVVVTDTTAVVAGSRDGRKATEDPCLLTEAQRNKMKVLTEEFGFLRDSEQRKSLPDINLNTLPDSELTDLQRNRKRVMDSNPFSQYHKDPLSDRVALKLNLDTDLARNRHKVLNSEYDIIVPALQSSSISTTTFTAEIQTPMSTTSDTSTIEPTAEAVARIERRNDLENGNLCSKSDLKINVKLANECKTPNAPISTAATQPDITPESALNTAGFLAKQGFEFVDDEKKKKQQQEAVSTQNVQFAEPCSTIIEDHSQPYKRCEELIATDFRCPSNSSYFCLPTQVSAASDVVVLTSSNSNTVLKQLTLNSMNAMMLTGYLQMSVAMPMETHFNVVNNEVMRLFLVELRILDHFRSLRHYFFLMDGEFGVIVCDSLISQLENGATPERLFNYQWLRSILDGALGSSVRGKEKNAENLSFSFNNTPDTFDLTSPNVFGDLTLNYQTVWPLNLILNPETLSKYAEIFKYLLKVRRISWILERAHQILHEAAKKNGRKILKSPQYNHVQLIRHKFYHFVNALQNHITSCALQGSWKKFKDELSDATCIEEIYRKHTDYVKRVMFLCMLNRKSAEFYNTIESILKIALKFYNGLKSREFKVRTGDEHYTHSRYEKLVAYERQLENFIKFTLYLGNKIVQKNYQKEIGEFIGLINYNQYYVKVKT